MVGLTINDTLQIPIYRGCSSELRFIGVLGTESAPVRLETAPTGPGENIELPIYFF